MKKEYLGVISNHLRVQPVFINSALVSAHNRQRYYWANWDFEEPTDKKIILNDIIEGDFYSTREKSYCIDANYGKGTNFKRYFLKGTRQIVLEKGYFPNINNENEANSVMHRDGNRWRKLTSIECERLQTVPDNYTNHVNELQRYKMLGNGWTVDVIAHIFKQLQPEVSFL